MILSRFQAHHFLMVRGGLFAKASKKIEISLYNVHFKSIYSIIADMVLFLEFFFVIVKGKEEIK